MSFAWPAGLAFAGLLPLVLILYFLKLRRTPRVVSSTWLWRRALDEYRVNHPFRRFQNHVLLWLQLLALAFLVFALARPSVRAAQDQAGVLIYLLDHSASMNAREEGGTRLDLAKDAVRAAIRGKRGGDRMMILGFSDRAFEAAPLTTDPETLLRALDAVGPTERPSRIAEAWRAALSVARQFDHADLFIVSDGGFGPLEQLTQANATVHYVPVGRTTDNAGIVHVEARDGTEGREIFARVAGGRRAARVELHVNDRLVDVRDVTIPAGGSQGVLFRRRGREDGVAEVRLPARDALDLDNRAWLPLQLSEPAKVLLVAEDNVFLRQVLANDPGVELSQLKPSDWAALAPAARPAADLVVFDGVAPRELPAGTTACFGPPPAIEGFGPAAVAADPRIRKWDEEHPLARFVNFSTLHLSQVAAGPQPAWMKTLLSTDKGPAISWGERGGARLVWVRFPLLESDWPLRLSFPVFVANLVRWAREEAGDGGAVRPGEPLAVAVPADGRSGTLVLPGGREVPLAAGAGRRIAVAETDRAGVYRARWGGRRADAVYAVNLADPRETDLAVPKEVVLGDRTLTGQPERTWVRRELLRWLVVAAVGLLLAEWALYRFARRA